MNCPVCKKELAPEAPEFPFCSERCRIIDLGNWATDKYVIPSPIQPEPQDEEEPGD
jgi:endogenous inhibitor of DNA gyrase (YacG/DUF329 family)